MSETPMKIVVDLSLPKGERESIIPLTEEEIAEREAQAIQAAEEQALRDAELQAQADAKASAEAKLAVLGLSVDEIKALLG